MEKQPLISVIIPVYNAEKYLSRCLDSVRAQTYQNLEIILIENGSTDKSGEICDAYAAKDVRFKVFHRQNNGISSGRNTGLEMAQGEYVCFVDADDKIHPQMYQILLEQALQHQADIVSCNYLMTFEEKDVLPATVTAQPVEVFSTPADIFMAYAKSYIKGRYSDDVSIVVWNKLFRKAAIPQEVRFETQYDGAEDAAFQFKLATHIKKLVKTSAVLYIYYRRKNSFTMSRKIRVPLRDYQIWKKMTDYCAKQHYPAYHEALQHVANKAINLLFLLSVLDVNNTYRSTVDEMIHLLRQNLALVLRYPTWKLKMFILGLLPFPAFALWLVRTRFVKYWMGKYINLNYVYDMPGE